MPASHLIYLTTMFEWPPGVGQDQTLHSEIRKNPDWLAGARGLLQLRPQKLSCVRTAYWPVSSPVNSSSPRV